MTTETRNEAAERLLSLIHDRFDPISSEARIFLTDALAAERSATVERIREAMPTLMQAHQDSHGRLPEHARFHCGGTCGYDIAARVAE